MNKRYLASCLIGATGLALAACSDRPMDIDRTFSMTPPVAHGTGAKTRLITTTTPGDGSTQGRVKPKQIVCAEASPDTASSISSAMTAAFSGSGSSQGQGIAAEAAGQFGKAVAESLVQLGERTASIQLLRDGYHRACEAYANGAISDITYALIISRLDEVMVTMMTSELAAGAFGRSLASTSGNAGTSQGDSAASVAAATDAVNKALADLGTATTELGAAETALSEFDAKNKPSDPSKPLDPAKQKDRAPLERDAKTKKDTLGARQQQLAAAQSQLQRAQLGAGGTTASQTGTGAGAITAKPDKDTAAQIGKMYERFMDGNPLKKMVVACITALDRSGSETSPMHKLCEGFFKDVAKESAQARVKGEMVEGVVRACSSVPADKRLDCIDKLTTLVKPTLEKIGQKADAAEATGDPRPAVASAPLPPLSPSPPPPKKP